VGFPNPNAGFEERFVDAITANSALVAESDDGSNRTAIMDSAADLSGGIVCSVEQMANVQ
jgi:hypothetical protein